VFAGSIVPDVTASSEKIAPSGRIAPTASATLSAVSDPVGGAGRVAAASPGIAPFAPSASASASSALTTSAAGGARSWTSHPSGTR
jgi:hypothetical protein